MFPSSETGCGTVSGVPFSERQRTTRRAGSRVQRDDGGTREWMGRRQRGQWVTVVTVTVGPRWTESHQRSDRRAAKRSRPSSATWRNGDNHSARSAQRWRWFEAAALTSEHSMADMIVHCRAGSREGRRVHERRHRPAVQRSDRTGWLTEVAMGMRRAASCLCVQHNQRITANERRIATATATAPHRKRSATPLHSTPLTRHLT